jgi:hypothetical protein
MEQIQVHCKGCDKTKDSSEFYKSSTAKSGLNAKCKSCVKAYQKEKVAKNPEKYKYITNKAKAKFRAKKKRETGGFAVYYLPEHHYIGMTNSLYRRMEQHRKHGRITEGYEVVGTYSTAIEAHLVETQLHFMGYIGFQNHW